MLDRAINLLSIFCFVLVLAVTYSNTYRAWMHVNSWEKEWVKKPNVFDQFDNEAQKTKTTYDLEKVISALGKANQANDYKAVAVIEELLEANFSATGKVHVRIAHDELIDILVYLLVSCLSFSVPLCLNYIRHGKFRIWNKHMSAKI